MPIVVLTVCELREGQNGCSATSKWDEIILKTNYMDYMDSIIPGLEWEQIFVPLF